MGISAHSGFLQVDEYGSQLYFVYFPFPQENNSQPLILWTNGGPGSSAMFGLFSEIGPFYVSSDDKPLRLIRRRDSWTQFAGMIFVDNPVGTGFSRVVDPQGFCTTEAEVAADLTRFLTQFFLIFPEAQQCPFYLAGESYGGKYVPSTANYILSLQAQNGSQPSGITLSGIIVGDGLFDPISQQTDYSSQWFYAGLINEQQAAAMQPVEQQMIVEIKQGNYTGALQLNHYLQAGLFANATAFTSLSNLNPDIPLAVGVADETLGFYLNKEAVQAQFHTGRTKWSTNNATVSLYLADDQMRSVKSDVESLLNARVSTLFYNGNWDLNLGPALAQPLYTSLNWFGLDGYLHAPRSVWRVGRNPLKPVSGYVQQYANFATAVILNAGHQVPVDQSFNLSQLVRLWLSQQAHQSKK